MGGWLRAPTERKAGDPALRIFGGALPDPEFPSSSFLHHVTEGWDKNELVYACIAEKATSAPEAPMRVYPGGRGEALDNHPLRTLIEAPNPHMTEYELFEMVFIHLDLAGNAFWEVVRDRAGRVVELWPLRPDKVRLVRGRRTVQYRYHIGDALGLGVGGPSVPIECVHFRLPNPIDPIVGTPPMRAALRATAVDNEATNFVKALLQNYAVPGVVVTMADLEDVLDDDTTQRLTEKWRQRYSGRRRGDPAFLQTGMDVKEIGLSLKDLEFPDLRSISESRICMSFGVPPILVGAKVGLDRSTFANYKEARASLWEETLMPLQRRIKDTIKRQLLPLVSPPGPGVRRVEPKFDHSEVPALKEAESARWDRAVRGFRAGGLTMNDFRRSVGLEEVDGGDVFFIPSGIIATRDLAGVVEQVNQPTTDPDVGEVEGKADTMRARHLRAHRTALAKYFAARRDDVTATIGGKAAGIDREVWDVQLADVIERAGVNASTDAGRDVSGDDYDVDRTLAYHHTRAERIAVNVNDRLEDDARDALTAPEPDVAVGELFDQYETSGTQRLATTLTTASLAWGAVEAGRQAKDGGRAATKTWVVHSRKSRHTSVNGETVGIDESFSNGLAWPGDPTGGADENAGCTCSVTVEVTDV